MAYITREDGERFVIPSYRDVLSAKKQSLLRKEILLLSENYGEYITIQRKNVNQYEVAFSPDPGYLLGETVWSFFKRPLDLIYCEAIPDTSEAILVIVKSGSVYLDGAFPLDVIADELIIFRTQQNFFDIYIFGNVPISNKPEEDKFAFDPSSIKSFTILEQPVFPTLPINKAFQLQPVEQVLKSRGIGGFPLKTILIILGVLVGLWVAWIFLAETKPEIPQVIIQAANPYQPYINALSTVDPQRSLHWLALKTQLLLTIPGWTVVSVDYTAQTLRASVKSQGATTHLLFDWAKRNNAQVSIESDGFHLLMNENNFARSHPTTIHSLNSVIAALVDSIAAIMPGNSLALAEELNKGRYLERQITIKFTGITLGTFELIGQQLKNLPLVLDNVSIKIDELGYLSGAIIIRALGN